MPTHWVGSSVELAAKLNLLGKSPAFRTLLEQIHRFAGCDATILIHGETGTGKELAARAMHYLSARRARPFIPLNCGCMPDTLIGSELFGHSRVHRCPRSARRARGPGGGRHAVSPRFF